MADQLPKPFVKALSDKIEAIRIREGIDVTKDNSELLSKLRDRIDWPEGFRISSLNDFFRKRQKNPDAVLKFVPQGTDKGNLVRQVKSDRPGGELFSKKGGIPYLRRQGKTKEFLNFIDNLGYDDALIEKYFWEMDQDIRKILKEIKDVNSKLPKGSDQKVSYGHLHRLSKSIDSPRNLFVELLTENVDKGNRYSLNPAGQLATGNPIKEGATWLENWKNDFLIYADRVENGGTGVLPQRGQYSNLLEQKFRELTGTQWDKLDDVGKASAIDNINDLIHDTEKLNQFTVKQSDELRKWGLLNPDKAEQAVNWVNDPDIRKTIGKPAFEVTELGGGLGGVGHKIHLMKDAVNSGGVIGKKIFKALPFVSAGTGLLLAPSIVNAAEERQEENPSIANWTQLQLERISQKANEVSAAALVPTVIPEPTTTAVGLGTLAVAETVDAVASGGSLMIDAARFIKNNPDKIQEFWTDVKPRLPLHTKEAEEEYKKNKEKDPRGSFAMPF